MTASVPYRSHTPKKPPDPAIETLRGLACVLLVLYHVIGATPTQGLGVAGGPLRWFNDELAFLRMPLFTCLSGLVYGLRPFDGDARRFLTGKVRRLLVPLLVVGTLFAVVQANTPGANSRVTDWHMLHILPVGHFWFVESLFWVYVVVWLLERWQLLATPTRFALAWACTVPAYLLLFGLPWFSIDGAIYLLPYFLAGLAVTRFKLWPHISRPLAAAVLLVLALFALWSLGPPVPDPNRRTAWVLLAGVALCGLVMVPRLRMPWLMRIGASSYAIYLFHVFFTAAARIGLAKTGWSNLPLQMALGLAAGLLGPMLIDAVASRHRWTALALLGKSLPAPAATSRAAVEPTA